MAITFRAVGTTSSAASGNVTPGLPSGWAAGDVHVCIVGHTGNDSLTMTGWTKLVDKFASGAMRMTIFYRVAVAGDTTPTISGSLESIAAKIIGYSGCGASPINVSGTPAAGNGTTCTANGVTTTVDNAMCLIIGAAMLNTAFSAWSSSATERIDENAYTLITLGVAEFVKAAAGATGNQTATVGDSYNAGYLLALAPQTGPANVKTVNGLAIASVKTVNGLAIASVKSINGLE